MTKEKFIDYINFIKEKDTQQSNLCSVLEAMSPNCYVDAFIYSEYQEKLIELLKDSMQIKEDNATLEYWLYELDYGTRYSDGCITDSNDEIIDISTVDKLYEYLIQEGGNN